MKKKFKTITLWAVKPKQEDWVYIPSELFYGRNSARERRREYRNPKEMEIVKLRLSQV